MTIKEIARLARLLILAPPMLLVSVTRAPGQGQALSNGASLESPEVHLARGHDDLNQHRYEQAAREFRAALALDPRLTVRARFPLAVTLFDLRDLDSARREFEAVKAETGDDPNLGYYLGRLDLTDSHLESAIHNLTTAASAPPFPDTDYYLGYAYFRQRDFVSAEKWLRKAAAAAPRDARAREHLGLLYRAMGRNEEAQKEFALAAQLHQQDVAATELALACGRSLETQPLAQAQEVCQKLLDPEDVGKLTSLGMLYGEHRDYSAALEPFLLAAKTDPTSYEAQYNLGLTYFRLKRYGDARAPLEKAVALRPDIFEVNAPLGALLYALNDDANAYRVLDHANRLKPDDADVSLLLCRTALNLAGRSYKQGDLVRLWVGRVFHSHSSRAVWTTKGLLFRIERVCVA